MMDEKIICEFDVDDCSRDVKEKVSSMVEEFCKHINEYIKRSNSATEYYYITSTGLIENIGCNSLLYDSCCKSGNIFTTKKEAEFELESIKVVYELKNFAREHNYFVDDNRYYIAYDFTSDDPAEDRLYIDSSSFSVPANTIVFSSENIANAAINKIGKDRILKHMFCIEGKIAND